MPTIIRGAVSTGVRDSDAKALANMRKYFVQSTYQKTPLTKLIFMKKPEVCKGSLPGWFEDKYVGRFGTVLDVYTDAGLSSAYASGGVNGTPLFVTVTAAEAKRILVGDQISIRDTATASDRALSVIGVTIGSDTTSNLQCILKETDTSNYLASATLRWMNLGHASEQLTGWPDETFIEAVRRTNATQIFKAAVTISGTEIAEEGLEYIDKSMHIRKKAQAFQRIQDDIEHAMLFGRYELGTGAGGRNAYRMRGLRQAISSEVSGNIFNFNTDTDYNGKTWLEYGWGAFQDVLKTTGELGSGKKLVLMSMTGEQKLAELLEDRGLYSLVPGKNEFGLTVSKLHGVSGEVEIHAYAPFTMNSSYTNTVAIIEPQLLTRLVMPGRDLQYIPQSDLGNSGAQWLDGMKEGWFAEMSLRYDNLEAMGFIEGFGTDQ